ncbi:MAG: EthD family reductase [Pseudomonadota bacterium]
MIKAIYFFNKRVDVSVEDFQKYWRTTHADLVRQIPGIQRCVQCHTLLSGYGRPSPPVLDGVEEISFNSTADLASAIATPAGEVAMADLANFVDTNQMRHIVTEEIEIKPGTIREGMVKNIELVTRKQGMPFVEFHSYWRDFHGPLAAKIEVIKRYVQSHTLMDEYEKEALPAYDGVAETWFADTAAMRLSATVPEYTATRADEKNFLTEPLPFIITREVRIM